jgi:hypothetical protein
MHARLAEAMDYVEENRTELLKSFADVPGDRLCRRATDDGWSVAEILEHLRMVEAGVARLITNRVGQAREAGLARRGRLIPCSRPSSTTAPSWPLR